MEAAFAPERGDQFLPPPVTEGGSTFLDALIRSATHSEAQVFTEATPPFKICHANNACYHFHTGAGCQPQKDGRDSAVHPIAQPYSLNVGKPY